MAHGRHSPIKFFYQNCGIMKQRSAPVEFLTEEEVGALVATPDAGTWIGARDQPLLLVAIRTGMHLASAL